MIDTKSNRDSRHILSVALTDFTDASGGERDLRRSRMPGRRAPLRKDTSILVVKDVAAEFVIPQCNAVLLLRLNNTQAWAGSVTENDGASPRSFRSHKSLSE